MVTALPNGREEIRIDENTIIDRITYKYTGPLLNPAIALGMQIMAADFNYTLQYFFCPLAGGLLGFLFHEFIFSKTMDILDDNSFGDIKRMYRGDREGD